jgi:hypothetical protein
MIDVNKEKANVTLVPTYRIGGDFIKKYIRDLKRVKTLLGIKKFIEKWKHLYGLHESSEYLFHGGYDTSETLECVIANRASGNTYCEHIQKGVVAPKCGVNVLLPLILLDVQSIAKEFGVPEFTALHQAFCKDPEHRGCF